jgi:RsiW-degrading membrane proteinase PrsW (M82 family)
VNHLISTISAFIHTRNSWLRILITGFLLFLAATAAFNLTKNPNLIPTVVITGNFLVPVAFVAFFYERRDRFSVSMSSTSISFFYGGILGTAAAALLEPIFIGRLSFSTSFSVGIIEELTKLIGVFFIAKNRRYNSEMDGIILGAAAGMGFAAFESTGYAFSAFLQTGGNMSETVFITLIRGLASPVGHGTWTAILSSILLRESVGGKFYFNSKVASAYLIVVLLHGLWDGIPFVIGLIVPSIHAILISQLIIGFIGLSILYKRWQEARKESKMRLA